MERLINRTQQGDLGEASAVEWLLREGAVAYKPVGYSPDNDLIADLNGELIRVQVKTTTQRTLTPDGHERFPTMIATNGGNQSWSGVTKRFGSARADFLFVLTSRGRRWFIPAGEVQAGRTVQLGAPRYADFEIDPTQPIHELVYGSDAGALESPTLGEYPRGQRMAAVNRPAQPSQVRLLSPPSSATKRVGRGPAGTTCVGPTRKVTLPAEALKCAQLSIGDRLRVAVMKDGALVLFRTQLPDPT